MPASLKVIPREIKVEITERCNGKCSFCHNQYHAKRVPQTMSVSMFEKWANWASKNGFTAIRLTGGEPVLYPHLLEICKIARGLFADVRINTSGFYQTHLLDAVLAYLDMALISLPLPETTSCDAITGVKSSLKKKLNAAKHFHSSGVSVSFLSVLTPASIGKMRKYLDICQKFSGAEWIPLRMESSRVDRRPISSADMQRMAEELDSIQRENNSTVVLGLAVPFCAVSPVELGSRVFSGRANDCGPFQSLTVTPTGELISCYSCRAPVRNMSTLEHVLSDAVIVKKMADTQLPSVCRTCGYYRNCAGGCRSPWALKKYEDGVLDYLANPSRIRNALLEVCAVNSCGRGGAR